VAALDWVTWHLNHQPNDDTCQPSIGPRAKTVSPHQLATSIVVLPSHSATSLAILPSHRPCQPATSATDVTRATCHPFSGDTFHLGIGPTVCQKVQICLTRVITWRCHMSLYGPTTCRFMDRPRVVVRTCHVSLYRPTTSVSVRTVWTAQSTIFLPV
jgi:hypothetical protein